MGYGREAEAQHPFKRPDADVGWQGHAHLGWESRYLSEGRDVLDGESLLFSSVEMGWQHLSAGVWYGSSPDQEYNELQLSIAFTHGFGDTEFYGGYTHFRFPFDGAHDNEIGAGFIWSGLPMDFEFATDVYYSFEAEGYFAELAFGREVALSDQLAFRFSVPLGMNQGYVTDGHDGANSIALRLSVAFALAESATLAVHATHSWALGKKAALPGDDSLIDFCHAGIGLQWSF
jgi:hypothetical protein